MGLPLLSVIAGLESIGWARWLQGLKHTERIKKQVVSAAGGFDSDRHVCIEREVTGFVKYLRCGVGLPFTSVIAELSSIGWGRWLEGLKRTGR